MLPADWTMESKIPAAQATGTCLSKCYGMTSTCPTLILFMLVMLLNEAIAATVVPYLIAMDVNVSPGFTV